MPISRDQFRQRMTQQTLLLDGAMGTVLHTRGVTFDKCFDALNLSEPAFVGEVHRAYIEAGADIIESNTFGSNRIRLAEYGLAEQVAELNSAAVTIARRMIDSSFKPVLLGGSIGPLGVRLAPLGRVKKAEAQAAFSEQAAALIEAGVDIIVIETMPDMAEVKAAIGAVRGLSAEIPIVTMMTFAQDDRTLLGLNAAEIANQLIALDIDTIGINCSAGPNQVLRLAATMRAVASDFPIAAMPNAGYPERESSGRVAYPATPAYFADYAHAFVEAGINVIGGCCGTTDAHIAAMREALDNPVASNIDQPVLEFVEDDEGQLLQADPPTKLKQALLSGDFIKTVEMRPPKGIVAQKLLESAETLINAGAAYLDIADIPLARMRMSAWAAAYLVQQATNVETILHFPTRGRNLLRVQADLLAAHALGVRNLFVTMGDPARIGDYPDASDNYDIVSTGLIKLIKEHMNAGLDKSGAKLDQPTNFTVGSAASLTPRDHLKEAKLLDKKIRFGADFAITQPCFDVEKARQFLDFFETEFGPRKLPIIVGIQPMFNSRNAEFLHNEVPGIDIPEHYRTRMRQAQNPQAEGVAIAKELVSEIRDVVEGVYVIPAFGRYDLAAEILEAI